MTQPPDDLLTARWKAKVGQADAEGRAAAAALSGDAEPSEAALRTGELVTLLSLYRQAVDVPTEAESERIRHYLGNSVQRLAQYDRALKLGRWGQ